MMGIVYNVIGDKEEILAEKEKEEIQKNSISSFLNIVIDQPTKTITLNNVALHKLKNISIELLQNNVSSKSTYLYMYINEDATNSHYKVRYSSSTKSYPIIGRFVRQQYTMYRINLQWINNKVYALSYYGGLSNTTRIVYYEYLQNVEEVNSITFASKYNADIFGANSRVIVTSIYTEDINDN